MVLRRLEGQGEESCHAPQVSQLIAGVLLCWTARIKTSASTFSLPDVLRLVVPASAQGELAAKVWVPALVIVVLAVVLPLPLHHLRLRIIARTRDHAAMVAAAMPQQEQLKGMEEACGEGEGGARRQSCGGATWAYAERAWTWLAPVLEVVEPRLCVIIYWTDIVSDFVFVTNYKGWSRQPAPAITVLLIILGNMVRGPLPAVGDRGSGHS